MPTTSKEKSGLAVRCAHTKLVPLGELKPNPRNPNKHPSEQIALLANIIRQTGWRNPIVVSERSGFIVKGHARYAAAQLLQAAVVPVDFQNYDSDQQETADLLADNKVAELAERDSILLRDILESFPKDQLELTGYTADDMAALFPGEMEDAEADLKARLEEMNPKPAPSVAWILVAVPFDRYGRARPHLEALEQISDVVCKTTREK